MRKFFLLLLLCATGTLSAQKLHLLPQPKRVEQRTAPPFRITPTTPIAYDAALEAQARYLHDLLQRSTGYDLPLQRGGKKGIVLALDPQLRQAEAYRLTTDSKRVSILGADAAGAFYGIQTFLQLLPAEVYSDRLVLEGKWTVPAVEIADAPNHPWRGMMLDVARYFYDIDFIKRYIDLMAVHKLNKLQLHLIDDSGWRLEIKRYPRLTEVGAWAGPAENRLGGYYTQEEMRDLVRYAQVRGVEIIPEIEFPAHILSAVAAYPWLSCTGEQHEVPLQHFISRDLLCPGKPTSMEFLENVLDEVVALFPSPIINIGGDEAVYDRWAACPHCKALMEREGITQAADLQGWLTNRVAKMMQQKHRTCMGWEEIIQRGKVDVPVIALLWHNEADSIQATRTGHKAVLTPASHLYFDFPEADIPGEVQAASWMPPISLEKVYSLPVNDHSAGSTVLGVHGCLWSDQFIHGTRLQELTPLDEDRSERYAEYLTFPRLVALSEVGWVKNNARSWSRFSESMAHHYHRLDALDVHYRLPQPQLTRKTTTLPHSTTLTYAPTLEGSEIVYTLDGTYPHRFSPRYTQPVVVDSLPLFRAATLWRGRVSLPTYFTPDLSQFAHLGQPVDKQRHHLPKDNESFTFERNVTGKLPTNGDYEVSLVQTLGLKNVEYTRIELYKRDELVASADAPQHDAATRTTTFALRLDKHEAGTPFRLVVHCKAPIGDTEDFLFVKKLNAQ